jgi:hypothetical protein
MEEFDCSNAFAPDVPTTPASTASTEAKAMIFFMEALQVIYD